MRLEKKRNYGKAKDRGQRTNDRGFFPHHLASVFCPLPFLKKLFDPRFHQRVELCLQLAALSGIGEDLGGDALALRWVGDQFMNDVVGVDRLDAKFVQITSEKRFPAGNAAGKGNLHDKGKPKFGS